MKRLGVLPSSVDASFDEMCLLFWIDRELLELEIKLAGAKKK